MAKIIEGNLILDDDTVFDESLEVHGSIIGKNGNRYNLTVNGNISARDMSTWDITAGNITARDITAKDIIAKNITAEDISAWDISAKGISANDITAEDIEALNIDTGNIKAIDIYAWNITALNIEALNINAWNISARNISYYAVCFAYKNIKCKSIKGTRNNARHFVIDGKIEVVK